MNEAHKYRLNLNLQQLAAVAQNLTALGNECDPSTRGELYRAAGLVQRGLEVAAELTSAPAR